MFSPHIENKGAVDLKALEHKSTFSRKEFCARNGICIATLTNWLRQGIGPNIMQVGGRVLISREAEADWKRRLEAGSVVLPQRGRPSVCTVPSDPRAA